MSGKNVKNKSPNLLVGWDFCQVNIYVQVWKMGHIMEVLKYSQAIWSCLITYPTRSVLFAVKISGKTSFKFMGKQDQALYLICFYLCRRFLVPLKCAYRWSHDPCCPCVLARSSSSYSAQTWQHARLPAVLVSPGGLHVEGCCFFIRITKFPLQILPPRNKRKICFHQENKENILSDFLGISDGYDWKQIPYSVSK